MVKRISAHLRGNLIAYLAMFLALSGTAVAAKALRANSVGSRQIKPGAVRTSDLANNAVTSPKIKNRTISAADIATSVPGVKAYAHITESSGAYSVDTANSKNVSGVSGGAGSGEDGQACVNASVPVKGAAVTPEFQGVPAGGFDVSLQMQCTGGDALVTTTDGDAGGLVDNGFFIVLY